MGSKPNSPIRQDPGEIDHGHADLSLDGKAEKSLGMVIAGERQGAGEWRFPTTNHECVIGKLVAVVHQFSDLEDLAMGIRKSTIAHRSSSIIREEAR
jgi:hypothetical protein